MSYDPTLSTDNDWVRFLSGDTDPANERLVDDEITGILADETAPNVRAKRRFAAATALESVLAKLIAQDDGEQSKTVEEWEVELQRTKDIAEAFQLQIIALRERATQLAGDNVAHFYVST